MKKSWPLIAAGVALVVFVAWNSLPRLVWAFRSRSNHVRIANESGVTVGDVRLLVLNVNDRAVVLDERVKELPAGAGATFEHRCNDSTLSLSFVLDGDRKTFDEPYVDLWTGEGWLLTIQSGGRVTSELDDSHR